jgi:hypothetical protein
MPPHPRRRLDGPAAGQGPARLHRRRRGGCWLAARARAGDGTSAHTTPVYVVREGLRFWKFEWLDELLTKRLASLAP